MDRLPLQGLEANGNPEVLLRLVGAVATAYSAAEVVAEIPKETPGAQAQTDPKALAHKIIPG
jgi:hypothetical protein